MQDLADKGQDPPALKNRPTLTVWTQDLYQAFQTLSSSRPVYMGGLGPIPLTEILAYCELYEIYELDEVDRFVMMMRGLDSKYLELKADKTKPETQSNVASRNVAMGRRSRFPRRG